MNRYLKKTFELILKKNKIKIIGIVISIILFGCGRYVVNRPEDLSLKSVKKTNPTKTTTEKKAINNSKPSYTFLRIGYTETGIASWYGKDFHGKYSASGEKYNIHELSAAHKYLPIGTLIKVEDLETGRLIKLTVKDRGPYIDGRVVDLSRAAAKKIGYFDRGITKVKLTVLKLPETFPNYFVLQMGLFSNKENAVELQKKIVKEHFPAFIVTTKDKNFRLVVGPFTSEKKTIEYQERLQNQGFEKGSVKIFTLD